jgi:hypothetical protein
MFEKLLTYTFGAVNFFEADNSNRLASLNPELTMPSYDYTH